MSLAEEDASNPYGQRSQGSVAKIPESYPRESGAEHYDLSMPRQVADIEDTVLSRPFVAYKKSLTVDRVSPIVNTEKMEDIERIERPKPILKVSTPTTIIAEHAVEPPKVEMRNSGIQGPPNLLYQIFYETLERRKQEGDKDSPMQPATKPANNVKSSTMVYHDDKVTHRVISQSQLKPSRSAKKKAEEANHSIKDIVFADGLLDAFDDNTSEEHADNHEILRNLEEKSAMVRKEYTDVIEEEMLDGQERGIGAEAHYDVVDLRQYPDYLEPKNQMLLKASSLFDNSILMENSHVTVYCKTERAYDAGITVVQVTLTYKAKAQHLTISTRLISSQHVLVSPAHVFNCPLVDSISQSFTVECREDFDVLQFPCLQLTLAQYHNHVELMLPLPFSINKFVVASDNRPESICSFLEHVSLAEPRPV